MTAKRVLISIDERLLVRVDQAARRSGMTRSAYLAQLASRDLDGGGGPGGGSGAKAASANCYRRPYRRRAAPSMEALVVLRSVRLRGLDGWRRDECGLCGPRRWMVPIAVTDPEVSEALRRRLPQIGRAVGVYICIYGRLAICQPLG